MNSRAKQTSVAYVQEIKYQTKMLQNLKSWLRNMIVISSLALILILFGEEIAPFVPTVGIVLMALSVIACLVIGLALKNGKANIDKLINHLEK